MNNALEVQELLVTRGDHFRIEITELTIQPGSLVGLVGPSGCGKSTLLDVLGLILTPDHIKSYRLSRRNLSDIDIAPVLLSRDLDYLARLRRDHYGFVLQTGGLLPFLTARENIGLAGGAISHIEDLARELGIFDILDTFPDSQSAGQRQRVSIARALQGQPEVILADEPTASLDPLAAEKTIQLLAERAIGSNSVLLVASHDWKLLAKFGFRRLESHVLNEAHQKVTRFEWGEVA